MGREMTVEEVTQLNTTAQQLYRAGDFAAAAAAILQIPPGKDYVAHPFHDLSWHFCEGLADALKGNPAAAMRLYELAHASAVKDASCVTSAAEGYAQLEEMKRIKGKQLRASRRARKK